jgi:hypothetical protein
VFHACQPLGDVLFADLWHRILDDSDKDGTHKSKHNDAIKANEPIAHLPHIGPDINIHLVKASVYMLEALPHALGKLIKLIFADKLFSHSDVSPHVEILSYYATLLTRVNQIPKGAVAFDSIAAVAIAQYLPGVLRRLFDAEAVSD